ncbi:MAG: alpha/beta hydrolase [Polyangiaceae bacterium]
MRVRGDGVELHVEDFGGGGEPLLLVMGIGAQKVYWPDELCARLTARGFRVVRMDNRDVGESSHLSHLPVPDPRLVMARALLGLPVDAPYNLSHMAHDLTAVLDGLGLESAHVAGMSMGGMIAQTFAIEHGARARSLASIASTTGDRRYAVMARPKALGALLGPPPRTREEYAERMVAMQAAIGGKTHPRDDELLRHIGRTSYDRGPNPAGFARQLAAIAASGSRRRALAELRVPTLVIHGTQDPLVPVEAGRATARLVPGARLLELADMGHDLPRPLWDTLADALWSHARDALRAPPRGRVT